MRSSPRFPVFFLFSSLLVVSPPYTYAQSAAKGAAKSAAAPSGGDAQRALALAESGHCKDALPLLKKAIRQITDKDLKKHVGLDGVHCAMTHGIPYDALDFLAVLSRDFPRDP